MKFFMLNPRDNYAGYSADVVEGEIDDGRIIPPHRKIETSLREYLGDPPDHPKKKGDIHMSANCIFASPSVRDFIRAAAKGKLISRPVKIIGREEEHFEQIWVLNFVDCLDLAKTVSSKSSGFYKGKIGVIKRPIFDEHRWDGSDVFVVPQDPSYRWFVTEAFVAQWKEAKFKGAAFSRFLMDPEEILA